MNREIRFRGKVADVFGEWVYGYLLPHNMIYQVEEPKYIGDCGIGTFHVIPQTIGQYTGLKDKNGVEIYEGDILQFYNGTKSTIKAFIDWNNDSGCYRLSTLDKNYRYDLCGGRTASNLSKIEVIGNIWENKDLLEVSDENSNIKN